MSLGAIHAAYKNEGILSYTHDFNKRWRVQIDVIKNIGLNLL